MVRKTLLILVLLNGSVAFAQSKLRLGVNLDPVITWFSPKTNYIEKDGGRLGFNGGLMAEYYFTENYSFVSGFSITMLGGNLMYTDSVYISTGDQDKVLVNEGSTVAYNINYLSIPVALKLKTNELGYFIYFAQMGLTQQFNIGSKASSSGNELSKDNVSEEINLYSMAYFFGGGIEYNLGGQTFLTLGLFYNGGFMDVLSNDSHQANLHYITIRVGIFF
jgi:hypothetical protein